MKKIDGSGAAEKWHGSASLSTIDAILLLRHALFWQDMYDVHRFDARKILWRMGIQLKKFTTYDAEEF